MEGILTQPTVRQRRVAAELVMLRGEYGKTHADIARILNTDNTELVAEWEACLRRPTWLIMRLLMEELGVPLERRQYIVSLMADSGGHDIDGLSGWDQEFWTRAVQTAPYWKRMYVGLNMTASHKRMYHPTVIPSVLQTRDYSTGIAQHVLRAGKPELVQAVEDRGTRSNRLFAAENPLTAHAVFSEAALHHMVGSRAVMRSQLHRLLELSGQSNITIQVVPFDTPVCVAYNPFVWLQWPQPPESDGVVYLEHLTRTRFIDNGDEIADYGEAWLNLTEAALTPADTVGFITSVLNEQF